MPDLPTIIQAYVDAKNRRDVDAMLGTFATDAVVHDEGQTYRGTEAIRLWLTGVTARHAVTLHPAEAWEDGSDVVVSSLVSGDFPGSPIHLRHRYTLDGTWIAALAVA